MKHNFWRRKIVYSFWFSDGGRKDLLYLHNLLLFLCKSVFGSLLCEYISSCPNHNLHDRTRLFMILRGGGGGGHI